MSKSKGCYPIVIFFPEMEFCDSGYLCGEVIKDDLLQTKNYYIHEVIKEVSCVSDNVIGVIGQITVTKRKKKKADWITLKVNEKMPFVDELVSDHSLVRRGDCQIIVYDQSCFLRSELLLTADCEVQPRENIVDDHFKRLVYSLRHKRTVNQNCNDRLQPFVKFIVAKLIIVLKLLENFINKFIFVLRFSTLAIHMSTFIKNSIWGLDLIQRRRCFTTLKSGNYILGLIGDWLGGLLLIYWFMSIFNTEEALHMLSLYSEVIVVSLKDMVRYLMGSPADLKLNGPLNNVLGKFFLFHIDLWWAFLGYSRPLLEFGFRLFVCLGSLGLSFQIAILADLLAIASFHVYIIYVYAARLYNAQVMGLVSLSRVFLGYKRNPLPGRVDSCPYSTEQLLIGTIAFTVLLFLLPTTLVYYIVFTAIRLVLIAVGGLLTQARFLLSALPLYSSLLWLFDSPTTTSSVRVCPKAVTASGDEVVLVVSPVQSPWWRTVKACMPDHLCSPPPVLWAQMLFHLLSGKLIYPV